MHTEEDRVENYPKDYPTSVTRAATAAVAQAAMVMTLKDGVARFVRGDCNQDGRVNTTDAPCVLDWLFAGGSTPGCFAALNANRDDNVNLADAVALLNFLFAGEAPPVAPFPDCGPGLLPADETLGCETRPLNCAVP